MCALLTWGEGSLKKKKYFVRTGKKLETNILLFIIGKFFKEIDFFLKFGNLFRK